MRMALNSLATPSGGAVPPNFHTPSRASFLFDDFLFINTKKWGRRKIFQVRFTNVNYNVQIDECVTDSGLYV